MIVLAFCAAGSRPGNPSVRGHSAAARAPEPAASARGARTSHRGGRCVRRNSPCGDDATSAAGADIWGVTATPEVTAGSPRLLQRGLIVLIGFTRRVSVFAEELVRRLGGWFPVRVTARYVAIGGYDRALALATQAFVALVPMLIVVAAAVPDRDRPAVGVSWSTGCSCPARRRPTCNDSCSVRPAPPSR
jgi:hypothetical protein